MDIIVQKYGGSSVATIAHMEKVAKRIFDRRATGIGVVVVVSAMGKTTDRLISAANQISNNPCKRELDALISTGEQQSIALLSIALEELGCDCVSLTGFQAGIRTKGIHTKSKIVDINIEKIRKYVTEGRVVVVAGFQGINDNQDITTLGRGGSDTTAVALAAKLGCRCEIYTDVEGIYRVDPRVYPSAQKIDYISYEEMMEMARLGARVMETRAVELGCKFKVPIYVALNEGNAVGTYIREVERRMEDRAVTGITLMDDIVMVTVNNVPSGADSVTTVFEKLADMNVNVDMISQSAPFDNRTNISFTCPNDDLHTLRLFEDELREELREVGVEIDNDVSKLSLVGVGMMTQAGVASRVFRTLSDMGIAFKQISTSEISISIAIGKTDAQSAVRELARQFNL